MKVPIAIILKDRRNQCRFSISIGKMIELTRPERIKQLPMILVSTGVNPKGLNKKSMITPKHTYEPFMIEKKIKIRMKFLFLDNYRS